MQYTIHEKNTLEKVNEIGMQIDTLPEENFIFVVLSPYLDQLMSLLKRLKPMEIQMLFMQYEGMMKVMRMVEEGAQAMEKELGLK
ncbi:MAG: hypothetical protein A3F11_07150 [Gammaproteobacteria bacterium RIFCSPHIGHO2_12_FULL_37_14]|nr:MAG: hypothetical protein A3F11_07150 [Gammaproteobacteria bacterium RIFCSPHIGHO2_12_FULL_37_14]